MLAEDVAPAMARPDRLHHWVLLQLVLLNLVSKHVVTIAQIDPESASRALYLQALHLVVAKRHDILVPVWVLHVMADFLRTSARCDSRWRLARLL